MTYLGEVAALSTAACWAITSMAFESAGKKIGSMNLNLLRLVFGFIFLGLFTLMTRGLILPLDASYEAWFWLSLSGVVGIVIGDILLFEAFVRIGARISMLIYSSVPPLSGLLAYLILGETMNYWQMLGMFITLSGISLVILKGGPDRKVKLTHSLSGLLFAFGGALGQAGGYIIGKVGIGDYDPFAATQIRLIAGMVSFVLIFTIRGYWKGFFTKLKRAEGIKPTLIGSFFGPFVGISLSMMAVQHMNPGVASTLISLTPIMLIPYAIIIRKEKLTMREIIGPIIAVTGLVFLF